MAKTVGIEKRLASKSNPPQFIQWYIINKYTLGESDMGVMTQHPGSAGEQPASVG